MQNKNLVLQRPYSNITISWFDFLHLLPSFFYLRLSKWMSREIHFRERQAWSSGICPICPVISWRDAHWATAVDTSWSLKNYLTLLLLCTLGTFGRKSKHYEVPEENKSKDKQDPTEVFGPFGGPVWNTLAQIHECEVKDELCQRGSRFFIFFLLPLFSVYPWYDSWDSPSHGLPVWSHLMVDWSL